MDVETFANALHRSLARRKRELSSIKVCVQESDSDTDRIGWLARAAIVMSYAHWEGFVKESSTKYVKLINARQVRIDILKASLQAACLTGHFKRAGMATKVNYIGDVLIEIDLLRCGTFSVNPEKLVDTESNLSSTTFREIVLNLGLDYLDIYDTRSPFIDSKLLKARNQVAHGELVDFNGDEAQVRIDGVMLLLDAFSDQLIDSVRDEQYLR